MSDSDPLSRRTVLQAVVIGISGTIGAAASGSARPGESAARVDRDDVSSGSSSSRVAIGERPDGATRYVGVVDRIVDGRHVVVLLEDGDAVVDQIVVPTARFDEIAEGDTLLAVVRGDELLAYRRLRSASVDGPAFGD
ncbi:hypothetical protein [Natrinema longum]|uniref:Uncharacterized protein n=1 Tax=Natrinema longum TaxID=370324 RepID=A0A8A2UDN0_9EURY|nr:hypothetical protein [Natrinema longum]MBZ6495274.1 hypothetical protein [Natrinema longum]QSW86747.1 hypothetical protein J0X27_08030 [Natrinema longum]